MSGLKNQIDKAYNFPGMISSWNNHYNAWKKIKKNYFLIKYESLINDPEKELNRIVVYLHNINKLKIDKKKINNILKTTTFDNFKKLEDEGLFNEANLEPKTNKLKSFFNTGPNQNWTKFINGDIKNEIEKNFYKEMKELGYIN